MITPSESKYVGWDGLVIDTYPSLTDVAHAERVQLVRWHRFLRSPNDDTEAGVLRFIIRALRETFPVHGVDE